MNNKQAAAELSWPLLEQWEVPYESMLGHMKVPY